MNDFIHLLTQTQTIYVFVSIIIFVFLIPLYQSIFGIIHRVNSEVTAAIEFLKQTSSTPEYEKFFDNFEDINNKISSIKGLSRIWHKFTESLHFSENNKKVYVSHRPGYYFNRDSILGTRLNLNQYLAFPNYLIGIGLTFTFIGLAAALHVAQEGLANGSGQQALKDLLAVASIKFISSIVGIISSITLSFIQRWRLKKLHILTHKFCDLLEQLTEYKSTERLLHENVQEQQKHTLALNDMATNIATGIGEILSNQLPTSVAKALEPLAEEIRALVQKFTGSNEDALNKVLQEFIAQLRKSSADDMQALIGSVKTLKESLDGLVSKMQSTSDSFGSETKTSTERLVSVLGQFVDTFAPIQQGISQFSTALGSLESIATKIESAGAKIGGSASENEISADKFGNAVSEISANLAPLQELTESLTKALLKVSETAIQLNNAGGTISSAAGDFKTSAQSIEHAGNVFNQKVQTFSNVADGIAGTINSLERATNNVSRAAEPLSEAASEFSLAIGVIKETEAKMQQNQQELTTLLINLQKYTDTIPNLWNQYESRFNKVDGDLAKAFNELTKGSQEFSSSIQSFVSQLDEQFSKAIKGLSGAIQELTDEREQSTVNQRKN
jgi:DNA repair exonuclease SbcCD ATPase subunit